MKECISVMVPVNKILGQLSNIWNLVIKCVLGQVVFNLSILKYFASRILT